MAWIEKRPSGYLVAWRLDGKRDSRSAPDKRTAEAVKRRVEQDIALYGRVTIDDRPEAPPSLATRLDAWVDSLALSMKPRSASQYADACVLFLRYLTLRDLAEHGIKDTPEERERVSAALPVTALDRDALIGFQAWLLEGGRSLSTVAKRGQALRLAWEWLREGPDKRWLEEAPRKIATRKRRPAKPIAPTWAEADAAVLACLDHDPRAPWLYWFAVVARFTGLRRSEILLLEWRDIEPSGDVLTLRGETTKGEIGGRRLPLAPGLVAELARIPRVDKYVIPAPPGERIAAEGDGRGHVDRSMRRAWTRAGVPPEKWQGRPCHAFRRTIQTEVELAGVRREVVEYLVGHQPAGTGPRHYLDAERALWPELVAAVKKIPDLPRVADVLPFRGPS